MLAFALISVAMLLLSALFSGLEIAFLSANPFKLALEERSGDATAKRLGHYTRNRGRFIATLLIGNNIALVLYSLSTENLLAPWLEAAFGVNPTTQPIETLVLQTFLSTALVLVFAEYIPKAVFQRRPYRMLRRNVSLIGVFMRVLAPIARITEQMALWLLRRLFRMELQEVSSPFTKADLAQTFRHYETQPDTSGNTELEAQAFRNALNFNETRVRDIMVPRTEIIAVDADDSLEELRALFLAGEHSRVVVYEDTLDNVLGYIHISALLSPPASLRDAVQPLLVIPEYMSADLLLREFNQERRSLAQVVDEFGGTAGLVTVEDLVEIVFGDIEDEFDDEEDEDLLGQALSEDSWLFSARWEVEDINESWGLQLPTGEGYNTLGGLYMHVAEQIPQAFDAVDVPPYRLTVLNASHNRIVTLRIDTLPEAFPDDEA